MEIYPYKNLDKSNPNIQLHIEELELKYLKRKTLYVNIILLLLVFPIMLALYYSNISINTMIVYGFFFVVLFGVNFSFYAYEDYFNSLKLAMYITTLAIYMIAATLIIEIQSPSVFSFLFLAYAVVSVYQDKKAAFINNISLFFLGIIIVWRYPNIFSLNNSNIQIVYIYIFLAVFVALLSISSFILINRKIFLFSKLAQIKETEIRMLGIVQDLKTLYESSSIKPNDYYDQLLAFSKELSKKIDIENIFIESDLMAAAQSLCGNDEGIAAILGTGSNSCYFDGKKIVKHVSPLGYILGDEGSGAVMGRLLVSDILKKQFPQRLIKLFFDTHNTTHGEVMENVYRKPFPNRYLARFTKFLLDNIHEEEIEKLVNDSLTSFFIRNIAQYSHAQRLPVHFTGSVAWYFSAQLRESAAKSGFVIGKITQNPMNDLLEYHKKNNA